MVGDGNAVRIPTQVANDLVRSAKGGFGVNDPILPKQRSQKGGEVVQFRQMFNRTRTGETFLQMQTPQCSNKLSAEDFAECFDWEEERVVRMNPPRFVRRDAAAWNDAMDMGMKHQILSPRVKDGKEADLGSQMLSITRHFAKCFCNGPE